MIYYKMVFMGNVEYMETDHEQSSKENGSVSSFITGQTGQKVLLISAKVNFNLQWWVDSY